MTKCRNIVAASILGAMYRRCVQHVHKAVPIAIRGRNGNDEEIA